MQRRIELPGQLAAAHRKLVGRLLLGIAAAFAFGFALVPLYDVLCEVTGLNGKTAGGFATVGLVGTRVVAKDSRVDRGRVVTVEFTGIVMPGLPWEMRPPSASLTLHPGELQTATFLVRNLSGRAITGQAVPSVTPGQAAAHFDKIECFCFARQTLAPGEVRELPLAFIVKPDLDGEVHTITLSYAFYNVGASGRGKQM